MTMHVKDGSVWKTANPKVKDSGVWKQVKTGSVRDGSVWKQFFSNANYVSLNASTTSISENNQSVTFTLSATGVPDGTVLYYEVVSTGGTTLSASEYNIVSADNGKPQGTINVSSNQFASSFYLTSVDDGAADGTKYFYITLRTGSSSGPIVLYSPVITIQDAGVPCTPAMRQAGWC